MSEASAPSAVHGAKVHSPPDAAIVHRAVSSAHVQLALVLPAASLQEATVRHAASLVAQRDSEQSLSADHVVKVAAAGRSADRAEKAARSASAENRLADHAAR